MAASCVPPWDQSDTGGSTARSGAWPPGPRSWATPICTLRVSPEPGMTRRLFLRVSPSSVGLAPLWTRDRHVRVAVTDEGE